MNLKIYNIKYFRCKIVAKLSIFSIPAKKNSIFLSKNLNNTDISLFFVYDVGTIAYRAS